MLSNYLQDTVSRGEKLRKFEITECPPTVADPEVLLVCDPTLMGPNSVL